MSSGEWIVVSEELEVEWKVESGKWRGESGDRQQQKIRDRNKAGLE
jgi:hypothetical protein